MNCPNCYAEIEESNFCIHCGIQLKKHYLESNKSSDVFDLFKSKKKRRTVFKDPSAIQLIVGVLLADNGRLNQFILDKKTNKVVTLTILAEIIYLSILSWIQYDPQLPFNSGIFIPLFFAIQIALAIVQSIITYSNNKLLHFHGVVRMYLVTTIASIPFLTLFPFSSLSLFFFITYIYYIVLRIKIIHDFTNIGFFNATAIVFSFVFIELFIPLSQIT